MTRIIMHGCNGRMGQVISDIVKEDAEVSIVAGIDLVDNQLTDYPIFTDAFTCDVEADVIIDFSSSVAVDKLLDYGKMKKIPIVICTTGLNEVQIEKIEEVSKETAVLKSANMSLGINTLLKLLKEATKVFGPAGYDMEIVEKHHNQKIDAPSGTALALADAMNESLNNEYSYTYDRSQIREKRAKKEIGLSAVRGGTIVGIHNVIYAGIDEVIEFQHTAYSKSIFAKGAVEAAKYLAGKPAGLYDMSDVVK